MPADRDPCPFGYNGDVGTSRLEEQLMERLHDPTPTQKRTCIGWAAAHSPEIGSHNVAYGSKPAVQTA